MARLSHLALALVGASLIALVLYNVELGLYKDREAVMHKLVLQEVLRGDCSEATINADWDARRSSDCIASLGRYDPVDIVGGGFGLMLSLAAPVLALRDQLKQGSNHRWRSRFAGVRVMFGTGLFVTAIADYSGELTGGAGPLDWHALTGFPIPPILIQLLLLAIGLGMLRKGFKTLRELKRRSPTAGPGRPSSQNFRGPVEKWGSGGGTTVGDLRRALQLDQYEDPFQVSTSGGEDFGKVGRICHYCNGAGCDMCSGTGELG
jgi:hypothetical protein